MRDWVLGEDNKWRDFRKFGAIKFNKKVILLKGKMISKVKNLGIRRKNRI